MNQNLIVPRGKETHAIVEGWEYVYPNGGWELNGELKYLGALFSEGYECIVHAGE